VAQMSPDEPGKDPRVPVRGVASLCTEESRRQVVVLGQIVKHRRPDLWTDPAAGE
jgi:hypothetical protein